MQILRSLLGSATEALPLYYVQYTHINNLWHWRNKDTIPDVSTKKKFLDSSEFQTKYDGL